MKANYYMYQVRNHVTLLIVQSVYSFKFQICTLLLVRNRSTYLLTHIIIIKQTLTYFLVHWWNFTSICDDTTPTVIGIGNSVTCQKWARYEVLPSH